MISLDHLGQFFFRGDGVGQGKGPLTPRLGLRGRKPRFPPCKAPGPARPPQSQRPEGLGCGGWTPEEKRQKGNKPHFSRAPTALGGEPSQVGVGLGWAGLRARPVAHLGPGEEVVLGPELTAALTGPTVEEVQYQPWSGGRGIRMRMVRPQAPPPAHPLPLPPAWGERGSCPGRLVQAKEVKLGYAASGQTSLHALCILLHLTLTLLAIRAAVLGF